MNGYQVNFLTEEGVYQGHVSFPPVELHAFQGHVHFSFNIPVARVGLIVHRFRKASWYPSECHPLPQVFGMPEDWHKLPYFSNGYPSTLPHSPNEAS